MSRIAMRRGSKAKSTRMLVPSGLSSFMFDVEEFREVIALRKEVGCLQGIIKDLARWLKNAGHPQKAAQIRKQLPRTDEGA